jgi:hypothetical protein
MGGNSSGVLFVVAAGEHPHVLMVYEVVAMVYEVVATVYEVVATVISNNAAVEKGLVEEGWAVEGWAEVGKDVVSYVRPCLRQSELLEYDM